MFSIDEYKAIFEASPDGCLVVASDGSIRHGNPQIEALFGWSAEELMGRGVELLVPAALRSAHENHRSDFVADPHNRPMGVGLDLEGQRKDGSTFPVEVSLSPWKRDTSGLSVICTVRDVTAQRRLRNFSAGALRASEDERRRIARELHDDTAQRLATLILRVRMLAQQDDPTDRAQLFEEVRSEIVDAADAVKRMSRGLRPPELEELGLVQALRAHVRSLQATGVFSVDTRLDAVDDYLDPTTKLAIYRIVQEALSNARRHSGTAHAQVTLGMSEGAVVAEVRDEGRGFTPADSGDGRRGLGLIGMQERAKMIGGRLGLESAPGVGSVVRVTVPVQPREGETNA